MDFTAESVREHGKVAKRKKQRTNLKWIMERIENASERGDTRTDINHDYLNADIEAYLRAGGFTLAQVRDEDDELVTRVTWE